MSAKDAKLKVTNKKGTTQWVFYYKIGSGTFTQFGPSNSCQCLDLGFSQGTPNGETSRRGDPETGANDHQFNLSYHTNDFASWLAWTTDTGQSCDGVSCIPGYHYTYVSRRLSRSS